MVAWSDIAWTFWLLAAAPLALLPHLVRWRLAQTIATAALRFGRAPGAVRCARRVLGFGVDEARRVVHELYTARLASTLDILRGLIRGCDCSIRCHGTEHVAGALARGRGVILWTADFPAAGEAIKIALNSAGWPLTHLSRAEHGFSKSRFGIKVLNPIRTRFEDRFLAQRVLYNRAQPDVAKRLIRDRLRGNGVVSITASAHEGRLVAEGAFLAGRLRLAVGALRIALAAGCPVLPVFALRDLADCGRLDVVIESPLALPAGATEREAVGAAVADFLARLEAHVRRRPGAWGGWRRLGQIA